MTTQLALISPHSVPVGHILPVEPWRAPCRHSPASQWHWPCPGCRRCTTADFTEQVTPEDIAQDGRCSYCRKA
jgi:hypothetical protein